jgi:hypothetical protein
LLALGWCTYGAGDQMSHYNVNASVPKTLIQHLIRWARRRSALPKGPKVSSGGSLSPRGDWRAPSDSSAAAWLREVERVP